MNTFILIFAGLMLLVCLAEFVTSYYKATQKQVYKHNFRIAILSGVLSVTLFYLEKIINF